MRLAWATDVHLDFLSSTEIDAFADRIAALSPHAVLLSGDISTAARLAADLVPVTPQCALVGQATWRRPTSKS